MVGTFVLWLTSVAIVNRVIYGLNNGLSPVHGQAIIWTNDDFLSIGYLRTNFDQVLLKIHKCLLKKMPLEISYVCEMSSISSWANEKNFCEAYSKGPNSAKLTTGLNNGLARTRLKHLRERMMARSHDACIHLYIPSC